MPFLSVLGYDVHDPTELEPEYVADFAKKRSGGPAEKVDYAIRRDGHPVLFVECKSVDCIPANHSGQLARYFNATPSVPIAVLTNGIRYLFFTDLEEKNILSERPFFEFSVLDFTTNDSEVLESFSRARYDPLTIRERVEEIIYTNKITAYMGDLLRNPSDSFTRFVLSELEMLPPTRKAARIIEKFTPTIRRAIQTSLLDMATRSIREQTVERPDVVTHSPAPAPVPAPVPTVTSSAVVAAVAKADAASTSQTAGKVPSAVITTAEELEAFEIVKAICADSPLAAKAPVVYRDTANWFTISAVSPRKWFTRLYFNQKRKSVATKVPQARAIALAPGFEVEAFQEGSRVYIASTKDLHRLRPLLLLAYEDEVKRKDAPESEGDVNAPGA